MILKDILSSPVDSIEVRTNSPAENEDMLFGYCKWDGENLISIDGDNYYLEEEIYKYHTWRDENNKQQLIVWIKSIWA